jgi:hypothetical protein
VNGKQAGETPFSGSVPMCSQIEVDGKKVDINLEHNKSAAYTHNLPTWKSTLLSVAIGAVGAGFILTGYVIADMNNNAANEYNSLKSGKPWEYYYLREERKYAENPNLYFGIGGVIIASAIGVYLWF